MYLLKIKVQQLQQFYSYILDYTFNGTKLIWIQIVIIFARAI